MRILCVGPLWRGSNAGGLFHALSREGCLIEVIDEFYQISLKSKTKQLKIFERIIRPWQVVEFNNEIKNQINIFKPEVLLVYKGVFVTPETLLYARNQNAKIVLFYPDVSLTNHGTNIPKCIPLYDLIFSTKSFGIKDMETEYGAKKLYLVPHGFDPNIHRPLSITSKDKSIFGCDVSFIGTYSPKKEKWLSYLKEKLPEVDLKIWGAQWNKSSSGNIKSSIQGVPIVGDLYAAGIQCSTINLGILSEQIPGASSGDLITSRTFHIPAANGFLIHERNEESVQCYIENVEAVFFDGPEEMVEQTKLYLKNNQAREKIKIAGHTRALAEHSLDARAKTIIQQINLL